MCGIAGLVGNGARDSDLLARMAGAIAHRGPDDDGFFVDVEAGVALAHRRLAILDITAAGHQPMDSADNRFVIVYNGEIYNHDAMRRDLDARGAINWRGHSDTETLIEYIARRGLEAALEQSVGMFAFALWDRRDRLLHLVRDRFGEKPLYYGWVARDFVFGSELKSLRAHGQFDNGIDRRALGLLAERSVVPAPLSIYRGIYKIEPGCILTLSPDAASRPLAAPLAPGTSERGIAIQRYWSYRDTVRDGLMDPIADEVEALAVLDASLSESIKGQMIADVPVGAFLSGGIDSSSVVALYQKYSSTPVRTFSIGFEDEAFNEAHHARAVAGHFGTSHNELIVTVEQTRDVIPLLPAIYDEPFADSSQIPTFLVSKFAREQVTVALTGDGADELLGGYNRHRIAPALWGRVRRVPGPLKALSGAAASALPSSAWTALASMAQGRSSPQLGGKLEKLAMLVSRARSFDEFYSSFLDEWALAGSPVLGAAELGAMPDTELGAGETDIDRAMFWDSVSYLPDDILAKVDRASMAVSLETRVPFLDHRVAAVAARIPSALKIKDGKSKHILRQLLYREAPRALFERPKTGFGIPVGDWIKGPLRDWAEDLLDPAHMAQDGWFDTPRIQRRWHEHLAGRRDSTSSLWAVLMFQAWNRKP